MKKILFIIVCLMAMVTFVSCTHTYLVTAEYEVCYPDGTQKYNDSIKIYAKNDSIRVCCHSIGGTNYVAVKVKYQNETVNMRSTTAPMRLNTYTVKRIKQ
jgi:flagellar basal body-associated protein FliL